MALLRMSKSSFGRARRAGLLPPTMKRLDRRPRWHRETVDAWLKTQLPVVPNRQLVDAVPNRKRVRQVW